MQIFNSKKTIAWILVFSFLMTQCVYAAPEAVVLKPPDAAKLKLGEAVQDPAKLRIPFEFAVLKEVHKGFNGKLIIHIQDAHTNFSGQKNLSRTMDYLMSRYELPLVLTEGSAKDSTLSSLRDLAPLEDWKIAAEKFLMRGLISGEEYLNLTTEHPVKLMGIEYRDLYDQNVLAYAKLKDRRKQALVYLHGIAAAVRRVKNKLYPKALLAYENSGRPFDAEGRAGAYDAVLKLAAEARIDLEAYPGIQTLRRLKQKENAIDFEEAGRQQQDLIAALSAAGARDFLKERQKALQTAPSHTSRRAWLSFLFSLARERGIDPVLYPGLLEYGAYLAAFDDLRMDAFFGELEVLEEEVYDRLLGDDAARKIRAVDRYVRLWEKACRIRMNSGEFAALRASRKDFPTVSWQAFLNRQLEDLGYYDDLIAYRKVLDELWPLLEEFYSLVDRRDRAFIENTDDLLRESGRSAAFLVAGGYHTENLTRLLRGQGYSYAVLTPVVTHETDHKRYEELLLQAYEDAAEPENGDKQRVAAARRRGAGADASIADAVKVLMAANDRQRLLSLAGSALRRLEPAQVLETVDRIAFCPERFSGSFAAAQGARLVSLTDLSDSVFWGIDPYDRIPELEAEFRRCRAAWEKLEQTWTGLVARIRPAVQAILENTDPEVLAKACKDSGLYPGGPGRSLLLWDDTPENQAGKKSEKIAAGIMERMRRHPDVFGPALEATDELYWKQIIELSRSMQNIGGNLRALRGATVREAGTDPFPAASIHGEAYLDMAREVFLNAPVSDDHYFNLVMSVPNDRLGGPSKVTEEDILKLVVQLPHLEQETVAKRLKEDFDGIGDPLERKYTILQALYPFIMHAEGMPGNVRVRFLKLIYCYVYEEEFVPSPWSGWITSDFLRYPPENFWRDMLESFAKTEYGEYALPRMDDVLVIKDVILLSLGEDRTNAVARKIAESRLMRLVKFDRILLARLFTRLRKQREDFQFEIIQAGADRGTVIDTLDDILKRRATGARTAAFLEGSAYDSENILMENLHWGQDTVVFGLSGTLGWWSDDDRRYYLAPGRQEQLAELHRRGVRLVLWTHSRRERVETLFEHYPDLADYFGRIYTEENFVVKDNLGRLLERVRAYAGASAGRINSVKDVHRLAASVFGAELWEKLVRFYGNHLDESRKDLALFGYDLLVEADRFGKIQTETPSGSFKHLAVDPGSMRGTTPNLVTDIMNMLGAGESSDEGMPPEVRGHYTERMVDRVMDRINAVTKRDFKKDWYVLVRRPVGMWVLRHGRPSYETKTDGAWFNLKPYHPSSVAGIRKMIRVRIRSRSLMDPLFGEPRVTADLKWHEITVTLRRPSYSDLPSGARAAASEEDLSFRSAIRLREFLNRFYPICETTDETSRQILEKEIPGSGSILAKIRMQVPNKQSWGSKDMLLALASGMDGSQGSLSLYRFFWGAGDRGEGYRIRRVWLGRYEDLGERPRGIHSIRLDGLSTSGKFGFTGYSGDGFLYAVTDGRFLLFKARHPDTDGRPSTRSSALRPGSRRVSTRTPAPSAASAFESSSACFSAPPICG